MSEKSNNSASLKVLGVIALLFGLVYAVVGTLVLMGLLEGLLPGHETQEIIVIVLAYAVALFGLICGIICIKGAMDAARAMGLVLAVAGLVSLVYAQFTVGSFNVIDCIGMVLGASILGVARKSA